MTKDNKDTKVRNKYNMWANIAQIVLSNYFVYVGKVAVFVFIVFSIFIGFDNVDEIGVENFVSSFTFVTTTLIDAIVLAKSVKVKGNISIIFFIYILLLVFGDVFILLILTKKIPITLTSVCISDYMDIFCCISPILELIYGVISYMQIERIKNYD